MSINFQPGYAIANEGCFYWGWFVACEMQIMLFMPILVYLLEEVMSPKVANFTCLLLITVGCIISYHILWSNNMSAGLFAP